MSHTPLSRQGSAKSRVEDIMREESRLSFMESKPLPLEDEPRPKYGWRLIRQCVRYAIDASLKADASDLNVIHGIHQNRRLSHVKPIIQMIFNKIDMVGIFIWLRDLRL
jgi:hypothetical protein